MTTIQSSRLSPAQVSHYARDGFALFHQPVFAAEKFTRLQNLFEENLQQYGAENLDLIHLRDERLLEFLLCDEILDLVEPVVGPNIGLWSSGFISKAPYSGAPTPWHEDSAYWDGLISTMENIATVWLAIDPATRENGCMKVLPGTHNSVGGFSEYEATKEVALNIFGRQIKPELINENDAVYFELAPNECSLHEARIIHGADANTGAQRRCGYTMRYFPTSSKIFLDKIPWRHKLWLARGKDIAGNNYVN
jgi:hypothetical protein